MISGIFPGGDIQGLPPTLYCEWWFCGLSCTRCDLTERSLIGFQMPLLRYGAHVWGHHKVKGRWDGGLMALYAEGG